MLCWDEELKLKTEWPEDLNLFSLALLRESARDGSGLLENKISNPWRWPGYERARGPATYRGVGPVPWGVVTVFFRWTQFSQGFIFCFASVQFSCSVMSDSLQPHELQHHRPPCPSPTPSVYSNSYPVSQLFTWGGQSIGVSASASVLPVNTQDWSPLGWTGWISL